MQLASPIRALSVLAIAAVALTGLGVGSANAEATVGLSNAVAVKSSWAKEAAGPASVCNQRARRVLRRVKQRSAARTRRRAARRARAIQRRCLRRLRRSTAQGRSSQAPAQPSAAPLTVGIDGGHDEWWSDTIDARAEFGAAVTRHEWDAPYEPVDAKDEFVLTAATQVHTRIHALLAGNDLGDAGAYRDWVVAFVKRYGPGGAFWDAHPEVDESRYAISSIELGNEPYFGEMSATEYASTVRPTLDAVKALGAPVKVILPSYIHGSRTTWIDTLYERIPDLNELFYAFADHPYWYGHDPAEGGDSGPLARIETLRQRMAHHGAGEKPIYITEYGESTASCGEECVSEAVQAAHLQTMLDAVVSRRDWGIELISVFQLHDWATGSNDREQQFGLLRQDGSEKPSYAIVEDAVQRYRG